MRGCGISPPRFLFVLGRCAGTLSRLTSDRVCRLGGLAQLLIGINAHLGYLLLPESIGLDQTAAHVRAVGGKLPIAIVAVSGKGFRVGMTGMSLPLSVGSRTPEKVRVADSRSGSADHGAKKLRGCQ